MDDENLPNLPRREFTAAAVLALLAGVTVTVSGCAGYGDTSPTSPPRTPGPDDVQGSIAGNHGHVAIVTGAQIRAGNAVTLNIRGTADHTHLVDLDANDLGRIAARQQVVRRTSNTNSHFHEVTFN